MQGEIQRQADILRSVDEPLEPPYSGSRQYFSNIDPAPVSPHQLAQDDPRRNQSMNIPPRQHPFRPAVPSHLSITPRRYGSIGANTTSSSPSSLRYQVPPPPPPHPLTAVTSPPTNLPRRHTSADIHAHSWQQPNPSPFASGHSSAQYPSSPKPGPTLMNEDQRLRDSLSSYSLQGASQGHSMSRPATPPFGNANGNGVESLNTWSWSNSSKFGGSGLPSSGLLKDNSGPPTRRGSMAHILNPAETAEREEEREEELREEDRKRKRV